MEQPKYRVYVCFGPNCGPKGSAQLLDFLDDEIERSGLGERVRVLPTGCQSHCESGPTMVVFPGPVYYQEVDRARISRIIAEHFVQGEPVADYFWTGKRRRIFPPNRPPTATTFDHRAKPEKKQAPAKPRRSQRSYEDVDDFKW